MNTSSQTTGNDATAREEARRRPQQETDDEKAYRERYEDGLWPDNIVSWDGPDDKQNPLNWSYTYRASITGLLGLTTMGASFASSSFSPSFMAVAEEFHVSTEVTTLTLSLYVLGFAFGPLVSQSATSNNLIDSSLSSCLHRFPNYTEGNYQFYRPISFSAYSPLQ